MEEQFCINSCLDTVQKGQRPNIFNNSIVTHHTRFARTEVAMEWPKQFTKCGSQTGIIYNIFQMLVSQHLHKQASSMTHSFK